MRANHTRMNHSSLPSWSHLAAMLLAGALCHGACLGQQDDGKGGPPAAAKPAPFQKWPAVRTGPPFEKHLPYATVKARLKALSQIRVRDCTTADLTLRGLARVLNAHLEKAGMPERVLLDATQNADVETEMKDPIFGVVGAQESLDKEHLVKQINSGSVADLLMHLPRLCGTGMEWHADGIRITESAWEASNVGYEPWYDVRAAKG